MQTNHRELKEKVEFLNSISFLKSVTGRNMRKTSFFFDDFKFDDGQVIVEAGTGDDKIFLVQRGSVKAVREVKIGGGSVRRNLALTILGPGDFFGVLSALGRRRLVCDCVVPRRGRVFCIFPSPINTAANGKTLVWILSRSETMPLLLIA